MAFSLLAHVVSDLCLGKPALRSLSISATVGEALSALKTSEDSFISVWSCDHSANIQDECRCVGKICMVDVVCYLCKDDNLLSPSSALKSPSLTSCLTFQACLLEAIDLILQGAQNLVVPIRSSISNSSRRKLYQKPQTSPTTMHKGCEYCWLTQEDVVRYLLSSIGLLSPIAALPIDTLRIIDTDVLAINYHSPASSSLPAILRPQGPNFGEISPFTLACCDETVAAAITTLSSGDLMSYIDCGGPPEEIVKMVKTRLKQRNLEGMLEEFALDSSSTSSLSSSSSDEESSPSPKTALYRPGKYSRSSSYSARMVRRAEAIVCHPGSSLVAVMIQAIAHRVNYVWVIEDDCCLAGIVTFSSMLKIFREHLQSMA
ncbi:hypothetical protein AAG906_015920 [Vitis piasezkii]